MDENANSEIVVDLGLKDQLIINVVGGIVGLLAGKLVEKSYIGAKTRIVRNRAAATVQ